MESQYCVGCKWGIEVGTITHIGLHCAELLSRVWWAKSKGQGLAWVMALVGRDEYKVPRTPWSQVHVSPRAAFGINALETQSASDANVRKSAQLTPVEITPCLFTHSAVTRNLIKAALIQLLPLLHEWYQDTSLILQHYAIWSNLIYSFNQFYHFMIQKWMKYK